MKRVVFVINSLTGGGAERVVTVMLKNSADFLQRHEVHLVMLDREPDAYAPPEGVVIHRLDTGRSLAKSVSKLGGLLRRLKPDVVVSNLTRSNFANIASSFLLRHKTIITEHAQTTGHHKSALAKAMVRFLYPRANRVIAVSRGIYDDLVANFGVKPARIIAIPNPIDTALIRQRGGEAPAVAIEGPYVLGMGRFVESKNFALLIDAFAASRFEGTLALLGDGPLRETLAARIAARGLGDRVKLLGFQSNPYPFIKGAKAYILPSNGEGFPNSLVEALALGTPVISTDCDSGPAEILNDASRSNDQTMRPVKYGVLTPTNAVAPMAEAIDYATKPDVGAELSRVAVLGADRYDFEETIRRYWREIEQILAAPALGRSAAASPTGAH